MPKTNTERQADWRRRMKTKKERLKTCREWKSHILARWREHNVFRYIKQEDGGIRILLEHSPEGDRITKEIAKLCGQNPDDVIQQMVGEILSGTGGVWIPAKKEGSVQ